MPTYTSITAAQNAHRTVNAKLVPTANPANQAKASGTTSSDGITFTAPTGGSGASTPNVVLTQAVGTGATLSGTGLGAYTVNNLEDGDVVYLTCTHTDDDGDDSQTIVNTCIVSVAAAAGSAFEAIATWDFTDVTNHTLSGAGTINDSGASKIVDYNVFTINGSPTQTFQVVDGTGLTWSRTGSNTGAGIAFDLADVKTSLGSDPWQTVWIIDVYFTSITGTATNAATICSVCLGDINNGISNNANRGVRITYNGTVWRAGSREYVSSPSNVYYEELDGIPSSGVSRLEVRGSTVIVGWQDDSTAEPGRTTTTMVSAGASGEVDGSMPSTPWSWLILWDHLAGSGTNTSTITKIVFRALGTKT